MESRNKLLWISAAALAFAVAAPAFAKGDAYTPGINGVTAPSVLPESRVDPVVPEGIELAKPVALQVEFVVGTDGGVRDIRVRGGKSHAALVQSTIDALSKWRFEPGTWNGKPVDTLPELEVRFGDPVSDSAGASLAYPRSSVNLDVPVFGAVMIRGESIRQWMPRERRDMPAYQMPILQTAQRGACTGAPGHCLYEKPNTVPMRLVGVQQPPPPPAAAM